MVDIDAIGLAREIEDSATFELAVLGALGREVGFDAAFFAAKGHAPTCVAVDAGRLDGAITRGDHDAELLPIKRAAMVRRGVAVDTEVLGEARVRTLAYHRAFAAQARGKHSLIALLTLRGQPLGAIMLGRTGPSFSARDIARVEVVLPSVSVARASYALPWVGAALPPSRAGALSRWKPLEEVPEGDLVVRDRHGYREMTAHGPDGDLVWSRAALSEPSRSGWFYVELLHLAAARARHRGAALFIGCGGAVAVRKFAEVYGGIQCDVVETDERVITLARRWFGLGDVPHVNVTVRDGAAFLADAPAATWDVIVVDAYADSDLPEAMTRDAFFGHLARCLRPGGALAFNVIGTLVGRGSVRDVSRAAARVLDDVRLVPVLDPGEAFSAAAVRNVVLVGSRPAKP